MFAPGFVPVFGVGEEAHDAGVGIRDGFLADGAGFGIVAHGHVPIRAAVDLVIHREVHDAAFGGMDDQGLHHFGVRDFRADVQMADGPSGTQGIKRALHPDAVEHVRAFRPQGEELVGVEGGGLALMKLIAEQGVLPGQLHGGTFPRHLLHVVRSAVLLGHLRIFRIDRGKDALGGLKPFIRPHVVAQHGERLVQPRKAACAVLAGKIHEAHRVQRQGAAGDAVFDEAAFGGVDGGRLPDDRGDEAKELFKIPACARELRKVERHHAEAADFGAARPEGIGVAEIRRRRSANGSMN